MEENLPPGFRFHPTDEELISYYLRSKVCDPTSFTSKAIAVVDLNKSEPWDLPGKACMGEKEWYFFSLRDRKYPTGMRTNRATESGYWKTTGKDKDIFSTAATSEPVPVLVGMKKTLVFYKGRAPRGEKTNWVMHEYRLHTYNHLFTTSKEEWVVCRVFHKSISATRKAQEITSSSSHELSLESSPHHGDHRASMVNNEFGHDDVVELPNFSLNAANSSSFTASNNNNILAQAQTNDEFNYGDSNMNSSMNNWAMLNNPNLYVSSLQILKALQLKQMYQQANYRTQLQLGGTNHLISNYVDASSSSKSFEYNNCVPPQQQQQQIQEQPFNMDSINWS